MKTENGSALGLELPYRRNVQEHAQARASVGAFIRNHSYVLLSAVVVAATTGQALNQRWSTPDFWVHLAAVREFSHSLVHPANPLVTGSRHDPYLSPYTFVLGAVVRITGVDSVSALAVAGVANLVLLLVAIRAFVRRVSAAVFAPVFVLLFTLLAWGVSPWRWSGFFDLNSIGTVLPLSSTFATAIGLLTIAFACDVLRGESLWKLLYVGCGMTLTALCHPMTAVWIALTGAAFVISGANATNARRVAMLSGVGVGALALIAAWPFFSMWGLLTHSDTFDASNAALYHGIAQRTFLAIPGFAVLIVRFARRPRDPLVLAAAFNLAIYVAGYVFDRDAFGRVLPGILLMAHVALGVWVAEQLARAKAGTARRRYVTAGLVGLVVVGVAGSASGVVRFVPRAVLPARYADRDAFASLVAPYRPLHKLIGERDVIVATPALALGAAATTGKLVSSPAPAPFVTDTERRVNTVGGLLSARTSTATFDRLLRDYGVKWFVVTPDDARQLERRVRDGKLKLAMTRPQYRVFRVVSG